MTLLPETVRVGYQDVKIILGKFNFEEDHGKYNDETAEIFINIEKPIREIGNTLIHEILHAIFHNYTIRQLRLCADKEESEEALVTGIANGLTQVFLDNPALLDWIRENLHNT